MKTTVNWGVLGPAAIATGRAIPAFKDAPSATLLGLASRNAEKGRAVADTFGIPRLYASYDALLADPDIDAVYVPLPNLLHLEWSVKALEAGKHVLCEKPLCMTAAEVRTLCEARDRSGRHIEEAFAYRNHPQWTAFEDAITSQAIGQVRAAQVTLAKQFHDPADIRNNPDAGGGALYDLGSYAINGCNMVFKRAPRRVVAALDFDPVFRIDRLTSALLDYGDCHAAVTVATQAGPSGWGSHQGLSVLGSNGWLKFDFPFAHARPTAAHLDIGDATSVGWFPTRTQEFPPVNQYTLQAERFSRKVLGQDVPSWAIEDALGTMSTIEAIFESGRSGGWVDVKA